MSDGDSPFDSRPVSRRGMKNADFQSPPPGTASGRPPTAASRLIMRPPSAQGFPRGPSRLSSAIAQPPRTGATGLSNINVMDRPITQQGVTGLRTATARAGPHRQVLDKRYFEGIIRMKMRDITTEIAKMSSEMENQRQVQSTSKVYEARVREVAAELTQLQGQLADLNVVVDKMNTSGEAAHLEAETADLRRDNQARNEELERLFAHNRAKEAQIQQLEVEIMNEKNATEKLIDNMEEDDRRKYEELKELNHSLQKEIEANQQQLDQLNTRKVSLEDKITGSQIKQEAVRLYQKLREREERKETLQEEEKSRSTPAQEREQLLQKVKEDNAEMAAMERQITQTNEQIKRKTEELELIEQDLEETQSDRHQKFKELKKREETMELFLSTYEEAREGEIQRIEELEGKIVLALEHISRNQGVLPGQDEFSILKENIDDVEKSKMTAEELTKKQQQLGENMRKMDELEEKIKQETETLKSKMATMAEDERTLTDLDKLRDEAQARRNAYMKERESLVEAKPGKKEQCEQLKEKNQVLNNKLNENETHAQLKNLETKLEVLETSNAGIREHIESKRKETDYQPLKQAVLNMVSEYNDMLKQSYAKG